MSEYSYHYSHDRDEGMFLEQSEILNFEVNRFDSPASALKNNPTNYSQNHKIGPTTRNFTYPQVSEEIKRKFIDIRRGEGGETMQLHTNFKTITQRFLRELIYLKLISKKQYLNSLEFIKATPSFHSIHSLLNPRNHTENLRQLLLGFYSRGRIIQQILLSRATFRQKIKMLKFLQRLRGYISDQENNRRWKGL